MKLVYVFLYCGSSGAVERLGNTGVDGREVGVPMGLRYMGKLVLLCSNL